jgi:vacuolar-type H+-ATPase subunit I/STV1
MTTETTNYLREAADDAADTVRNFADEILEQLLDDGKASDDLLNDYPGGDAWHHENHVDKWYSLIDAATLIDQLSEFEETDSGLWEGQQPKEAISTCAAFTYGNAVYNEWRELIEKINEEAESIIDEYDDQIADLEAEIDDLETLADAAGTEEGQEQRDEIERKRSGLESLQAEKKVALEKLIAETADAA